VASETDTTNQKESFIEQLKISLRNDKNETNGFLSFVLLSSCFLILLIIAACLWKIKQKYDMYRRRQVSSLSFCNQTFIFLLPKKLIIVWRSIC